MENPTHYKVIETGILALEAEINQLSAEGWRVITSTFYGRTDYVQVILERAQTQQKR